MRIYTDTSVIGGCFDPEFEIWSKKLISQFQDGTHRIVLSDVIMKEILEAPDKVQEIIASIPQENIEEVFLNDESKTLAKLYIKEGVLTEKNLVDAQHVAITTVSQQI